MNGRRFLIALFVANALVTPSLKAEESNCTQNRVDGTTMPVPQGYYYITPTLGVLTSFSPQAIQGVVPFYQWENNNGYCGEVSMMQAGLNSGQWMSQFNARKICGTALAQAGPGDWCSTNKNLPNYNAQLLLESPYSPAAPENVSGMNTFASAGLCLANSRLDGRSYPWNKKASGVLVNQGVDGYKNFMSWVKGETIAGRQVTIGVLLKYGVDPQYDHEVTVLAVGTRNPTSTTYDSEDVLYFDDHGAYTLVGSNLNKGNPAIPYGAGSDSTGCTPYVFGYPFGSLAQTRKGANLGSAQAYSIVIPGVNPTYTYTGGNGYTGGGGTKNTIAITGHNYGFSVSGAMDNSSNGAMNLKPIQLSITGTQTPGSNNLEDPKAGWQYENSMIGTDIFGMSCTNDPPQYWMQMKLRARVGRLMAGQTYNLYEYDRSFADNDYPSSTNAALDVPTGNFNSYYKNNINNSNNHLCTFRATATTETFPNADCPDPIGHGTQDYVRNSNQIVVFRAVSMDAL